MTTTPPIASVGASAGAYATQPWNQVIWPAGLPAVMTPHRAMTVPAIARCVQVIESGIRVCPLDAYRGTTLLPRPRLLEQPDPNRGTAWFLGVSVRDYLLNGNALAYVTAYLATGYPAAITWLPAARVSSSWNDDDHAPDYWFGGELLDRDRVLHVRRGADPLMPWRGIGVVEEQVDTLQRAKAQEDYESRQMTSSGVPSVVIITPNADLSSEEAEAAKDKWEEKFNGPQRRPAVLPQGTEVKPLGWSPNDAQMVEARKMSLLDAANIFNLDGWWTGAAAGSYQYKSAGAMWTGLNRQTTGPIMLDFEDAWSSALLPLGQRLRFDRRAATRDDFATELETVGKAVKDGILTMDEGREYLAMPAHPGDVTPTSPVTTTEGVQA